MTLTHDEMIEVVDALLELLRWCELDGAKMDGTSRATDAAIAAIRKHMPQPPYPQFCHTPDKCAQAHRCLRDPVCND